MSATRLLTTAAAGALLSVGLCAPAHASAIRPDTVPCATNIGVCSNSFCDATSDFGVGDWWFEFAGRGTDASGWGAYYYAGDQYEYYGFENVTCEPV